MLQEYDISFMDKAEILKKIFPMTQNFDFDNVPQTDSNADAYFINVTEDIRICAKFYSDSPSSPTIIYFHAGDETSLTLSDMGSHFMHAGINFFITDYRGYGVSDGEPTMTNLFQDCHKIYTYFKDIMKKEKYNTTFFIMGRSLGSMPAIELAFTYPNEFRGLIIESGTAQNFKALWVNEDAEKIKKLDETKFYNKDKIKEVTIPTLFLHGENDNMIPVQIAQAMYNLSPAPKKDLVIIPGGTHTNLKDIGYDQYYTAIEDFVKKNARPTRAKTTTAKTKKKTAAKQSTAKTAASKNPKTKTKAVAASAKTKTKAKATGSKITRAKK